MESKRYLLDTNNLSDLVLNPAGRIAQRIASVGEETVCTSLVVSAVIRFGAFKNPEQLREVPKSQRRAMAKSLGEYRSGYPDRNEAMARAYGSGSYSMKEIGDFFGVHYMTVSRAVRRFEGQASDSATTPP